MTDTKAKWNSQQAEFHLAFVYVIAIVIEPLSRRTKVLVLKSKWTARDTMGYLVHLEITGENVDMLFPLLSVVTR